MIKAIIFDCFGVVFQDNFGTVYEHFGGDLVKDREFIADVMHQGNSGKITSGTQQVVDHLGISLDEWDKVRDDMDSSGLDYELLRYIKELGTRYKIGMLTNVGSRGLSRYMDYEVLSEYFEVIVESAKIGFAKPEARAYEVTAERLGVRLDECVFIDDREEYVDGAINVGMQAVLYENFDRLKKDMRTLI